MKNTILPILAILLVPLSVPAHSCFAQASRGSDPANTPAKDNPVLIGGKDTSGNIQYLKTDTTGMLMISGGGGGSSAIQGTTANGASGSAVSPILLGGLDSGNVLRSLLLDTTGKQYVIPTASNSNTTSTTYQKVLTTASTNALNIKSSAGNVFSYSFTNTTASFKYVHFYNLTTSPTVGTTVPAFTLGIPANSEVDKDSVLGIGFSTGIAISITTGVSDTDSTATAANDVTGFIAYK